MKMQRWRRSARQIHEINQNMIVTDTPNQILKQTDRRNIK